MREKRYSRQREIILKKLQNTTAHPTAEMLYQWLKPDNPSLSLGTVYRNLNLLAEEGMIARFTSYVERYDANTVPHAHFLCRNCGRMYDIEIPYDETLNAQAAVTSGHRIEGHELLFTGICADCIK